MNVFLLFGLRMLALATLFIFLLPARPDPLPPVLPPLSSSNSSSNPIPPMFSVPPKPPLPISPSPMFSVPPKPPLPISPSPMFSVPPKPHLPISLSPFSPSQPETTSKSQSTSTVSSSENSWTFTVLNWTNPAYTISNIKGLLSEKSKCPAQWYSCGGRCGLQERRIPDTPFCFCDYMCSTYGDCCYDFPNICSLEVEIKRGTAKQMCLTTDQSLRYGYLVVDRCQVKSKKSKASEMCTNNTKGDLFATMPVFDWINFILYKNIFCAFCNDVSVENASYWRLQASCGNHINVSNVTNFHNIMNDVKEQCNITFYPPRKQTQFLDKCIPQEPTATEKSKITRNVTNTNLCSICEDYSMEWCLHKERFRNPHCLLCLGERKHFMASQCCEPKHPLPPPLSIFFDFQSTTKYLIKTKTQTDTQTMPVELKATCFKWELYDPFSNSCRSVYDETSHGNNTLNCTGLMFGADEYLLTSNSSVFIPSHGKNYNRKDFFYNGTTLVLCKNLTHSITRRFQNLHFLHLATYIGTTTSLLSIVILLVTYSCVRELRNVPGRITTCLAGSLFVCHVLYFIINNSNVRPLCKVISILMHYWLLASFLWMNAMAVCVHSTFTSKVTVVRAGHNNSIGTSFTRYFMYAWITPLIVVGSCFIYDTLTKDKIGYGTGVYCFIESKTALLWTVIVPVGIVLVFNFIALVRTMHHLRKLRKETSATLSQSHKLNLTAICLKITTTLGVTWFLGILAATKYTAFLWYPFVVCNSLQGFFLFVSFVLNRRTLALIREKLRKRIPNTKSGLGSEGTRRVRKTAIEGKIDHDSNKQ